jgi:TetR/AcrR family transcriptional regulator
MVDDMRITEKRVTRDKILEAARTEFAGQGLAGARVDLIARRAGVNKAMIYYHFRSKEKLYQAVIDEHLTVIADFLQKNIISEAPAEDIFLKVAEFINNLFENRRNFMPIMLREMADGGDRIKNAMTRLISDKGIAAKIKKMIESGIKAGRFRKINSRQAMISFLGMNIFYLLAAPAVNVVWEIKDEKKFRKERPAAVADLFLHGLKAK